MDIYTATEISYKNGFEAGRIAVENQYKDQVETLRKLLHGEWVNTESVQEALDITFAEGLKMFDFGRVAKWSPAPMNGQKIITKFRLCEKTIEQLGEFQFESDEETAADDKLGYL
jgi:hypothetical protein